MLNGSYSQIIFTNSKAFASAAERGGWMGEHTYSSTCMEYEGQGQGPKWGCQVRPGSPISPVVSTWMDCDEGEQNSIVYYLLNYTFGIFIALMGPVP